VGLNADLAICHCLVVDAAPAAPRRFQHDLSDSGASAAKASNGAEMAALPARGAAWRGGGYAACSGGGQNI